MKNLRNSKGTTLIELVAAVTIITIAMMPIMESITRSYMEMHRSARKTKAIYFAQRELEDLKANLRVQDRIDFNNVSRPSQEIPDDPLFKREIIATQKEGNIDKSLVEIKVVVKWGTEASNERVEIKTLITGDEQP